MLYTNQVAGHIALLLFICGAVVLHLRLRTYWSLSFIASLAAILIWGLLLSGVLHHEFYYPMADKVRDLAEMRRFEAITAAIEAVLMMWFGVSFLFANKSVRAQRAA